MMLLVDSGNSRVKWLAADGTFCVDDVGTIPGDVDDLSSQLRQAWKKLSVPRKIVIANVAGRRRADDLADAVRSLWDMDTEFVGSTRECCGLHNSYDNPEKLGVDRWMAVLGASTVTNRAYIVIDCGTATTIDLVDCDRVFRGGLIMPGVDASLSVLAGTTDVITSFNGITATGEVMATRTADAVINGMVIGHAGALERIVKEMKLVGQDIIEVLLTGGEAECLQPWLNFTTRNDPLLVFRGLYLYACQTETVAGK
jgi:type III pantothenate kinase